MNYKKMIEDIDDIVSSDFIFSMDAKLYTDKGYSRDDVIKLLTDVMRIYRISHQMHCTACKETKYL